MTRADMLGNPVSGDAAAIAGVDSFILGLLTYRPKMVAVLDQAETHPDHLLTQVYSGIVWMLLEAPEAPERAAGFIARARAAAKGGTERERMALAALEHWAAGDIDASIAALEAAQRAHPRDLVLARLCQYHHFNRGDAPGLLRAGLRAAEAAPEVAYVHSMAAFGYEQCHLIDKAEAAAHRALAIDRADPWAHHALAHVHLTRGTVDAGTAFLASVSGMWEGLNSFMYTHNWWHLALFRLSRGEFDAALAIYDDHVWGREKSYSQDQVGAASLLARMEIAGIDVGRRWQDVAAHVALRGADTVQPFLTLQYLYALTRAGRAEADTMMAAVRAESAPLWRAVVTPAAEGLAAHATGDWETAATRLGAVLPRLAETGGSHAQRDLFGQIHLDALVKSGRIAEAQQRLELRRCFDPEGVPLNRTLARVYAEAGLPELASEAERRVRARLAGRT